MLVVYGRCCKDPKIRWAARVLGQILLLVAAASITLAQNTVGTITDVGGTAHLERGGTTQNVTSGMPVDLHDKLTTDAGAHLTITLIDNSKLDLGEQSTMVVDEQVVGGGVVQTTKVSLTGGHLGALVTKALRGAAPAFQVQTPNAIAGVRGTNFGVGYSNNSPVCGDAPSTDVAVADGAVGVANSTNPAASVEVDGGYETVVCGGRPPLPPGPLGIAGMSGTAAGAGSATTGSSPSSGGAPPPACPVCPPGR